MEKTKNPCGKCEISKATARKFFELYRDLRTKVQKDNPDLWKQIETRAAAYRAAAESGK